MFDKIHSFANSVDDNKRLSRFSAECLTIPSSGKEGRSWDSVDSPVSIASMLFEQSATKKLAIDNKLQKKWTHVLTDLTSSACRRLIFGYLAQKDLHEVVPSRSLRVPNYLDIKTPLHNKLQKNVEMGELASHPGGLPIITGTIEGTVIVQQTCGLMDKL
ncbi:hypothetical protein T265_05521 [Opisthorchis viverrini]|uniref:Uncharacterized protein n=1 Tax=Opisthorchis viverrini TaxID=6198 RepID=A0A074ZVK6_OPIVI|nr:hypothetical protein T265_05521 [Opisthorchis viverrini]KER27415.1 hypothetical protein T265_05521 [Opisthorchis viverrini]